MYIGGLDIGTTGCKVSIYDDRGSFICNSYREYKVSRKGGEHEFDAEMIWDAVCEVIGEAAREHEIEAIGITSFGESFVARKLFGGQEDIEALFTDNSFGVQNDIHKFTFKKPFDFLCIYKLSDFGRNEFFLGKTAYLLPCSMLYCVSEIAELQELVGCRTSVRAACLLPSARYKKFGYGSF